MGGGEREVVEEGKIYDEKKDATRERQEIMRLECKQRDYESSVVVQV